MNSIDEDLEELMSHLGSFGKYQAWQFSLHIIAGLTAGLHMLTLVTVAAIPPHQCVISSVEDNTSSHDKPTESFNVYPLNAQKLVSWNTSTLPYVLDACNYIDRRNITQACESWLYDTTYFESSRGMEWNFVCSRRWMGAIAQSSYMFGVFIGAISLGTMADKYGRKVIFCTSAIAQLILGVTVALVTEYYTFLVIRFFYGIFGSAGAYITGFVLTMELVGASYRTICGIMFQMAFATGFMLVSMWGVLIKDRMWLQIVYGLHSLALVGHCWLMDESPRWLWSQGQAKKAIKIVQKGLKMNGSDVQLDVAKFCSRNQIRRESLPKAECSYGVIDLFKTPNLRKKSLNTCLNWFANSIVYYGLSLNTGNLVGNPFLMIFLSGLVELPAYLIAAIFMDRLGRRCLLSTFMLMGGVCCICTSLISNDAKHLAILIIFIVLFGKACIAGSFAVIYNYTAELFPTVLRNTALGIGSMCARLSGTLTPLIFLLDSFDPKVPTVLFGFTALISGFLALYFPETLNKPLPESLEDGENFGRGDTCFTTCCSRQRKTQPSYDAAPEQANDAFLNEIKKDTHL